MNSKFPSAKWEVFELGREPSVGASSRRRSRFLCSVKKELGTRDGGRGGGGVGPVLFISLSEVFEVGSGVGVGMLAKDFHPFVAKERVDASWIRRAMARFWVSNR